MNLIPFQDSISLDTYNVFLPFTLQGHTAVVESGRGIVTAGAPQNP